MDATKLRQTCVFAIENLTGTLALLFLKLMRINIMFIKHSIESRSGKYCIVRSHGYIASGFIKIMVQRMFLEIGSYLFFNSIPVEN